MNGIARVPSEELLGVCSNKCYNATSPHDRILTPCAILVGGGGGGVPSVWNREFVKHLK